MCTIYLAEADIDTLFYDILKFSALINAYSRLAGLRSCQFFYSVVELE